MSANLVNLRTIQFSDKFSCSRSSTAPASRALVGQGQYHRQAGVSPVNQVAPTAAVPVTERFTPIDRQDATFDRRWVSSRSRMSMRSWSTSSMSCRCSAIPSPAW
jgi:hypothetical protein